MAESTFDREKIIRIFKGYYSTEGASYISKIFCDKNTEKELKQFLQDQWDELSASDFKNDRVVIQL